MDGSTNRWGHGGAQMSRHVRDQTWTFGTRFCARNRGTVSCCGVHWLRSRMLPENTQNHLIFQTVFWFPHATFHQHRPSGQLCEFWRIFYTLVKGTSAGLGAISVLKDLEVHICMNTQIDQSGHEVRIDASAGRGWQHDGELGEFGTVPLQRWVCNSSHKMAKSK